MTHTREERGDGKTATSVLYDEESSAFECITEKKRDTASRLGAASVWRNMNQESATQYAEELRQFSASHRVRYGHQHDLLTLCASLESSANFRAEFGSMIRSILYREHEGISQQEILALVEMTWSGSDRFERIPQLENRLGDLFGLVKELMSRPKGNPQPIVEAAESGQPEPAAEDWSAPRAVPQEAERWTTSRRLETAWTMQDAMEATATHHFQEPFAPVVETPTISEPQSLFEPEQSQADEDQPHPHPEIREEETRSLAQEAPGGAMVEPAKDVEIEYVATISPLPEAPAERDDPWAEGSALHREVMLFAARRGKTLRDHASSE